MGRYDEEQDPGEVVNMSLHQSKRGPVQKLRKTKPLEGNAKSPPEASTSKARKDNLPSSALEADLEFIPDDLFNVYMTSDITGSKSSNVSISTSPKTMT